MGILTTAWAAAAMIAGGIEFQIDPNASSARVELCILSECDSDTSPLEGFITAAFDCPDAPRDISLEDFAIRVRDNIDLHLDYGFLGDIFATGTGVAVLHVGEPEPFAAMSGANFTVFGADYVKEGTIAYEATGIMCSTFQSFGYPCSANFILDTQPPATGDFSGTITVESTQIVLTGNFDIEEPLDPNNPDLGTIRLTASLRAVAARPSTADVLKLKARCRNGQLQATVRMADESHDGETARLTVNGEYFTTTINGDKAKLSLPGRTGAQTVRLIDPPNCQKIKTADCG